MVLHVGAAVHDITPPAGLTMSGFGARTAPAEGAHDPLTVRAVAVDDTAIVCADVIGFHEATSARIRARCALPEERVVLAASHTHGGPVSMPARLGAPLDEAWLGRVEDACVAAIDRALAKQMPATAAFGFGTPPGIARNRRHAGGPVDDALPVLRFRAMDGQPMATVLSYACHPVVLGPLNRLYTADYPGFVRAHIEAQEPGSVALFLTGCCGDANTGHSSQDSMHGRADPNRSFAAAKRIGEHIATCAATAPMTPLAGPTAAASRAIALDLQRREVAEPADLARSWRAEAATSDASWAAVLRGWADWAETIDGRDPRPFPARVSVLRWSGLTIVALPGEIFAATGIAIRDRIAGPSMTISYAESNPGYIPPGDEYRQGGYEVDEAHRYYGMPAAFAPGSAERLVRDVVALTGPTR